MQAKKNNNSGKNKHLTLNDRISIAEYLAKGLSFKEIALALGKSPSTISREIKRHTYMEANSFTKQPEAVCPQLAAPPFVCNSCPKKSRSSCSLTRHVYIARRAQEEYENLLKDSRSGIPLKKSSFDELDRIISGAVRSGQHIYHITDPIIEPENYSDDAAVTAAAMAEDFPSATAESASTDYPDIILVLSESFYDFDLVTDLQADTEVMPVTKNLPNAVYGHTISPHVGGGTNSSEYEMLSSNSLILMPSITPFNWLNLHNANSLVSYLKDLGYSTLAAHPYTNSNYRRDSAWLTLGFDETHFQDDFPTKEYYGNRPYQTDSASYRDFEKLYEAMPEDKPRFGFLVSIQSHGDYTMNDASLDIVHAATDYGEYDELMDEYLSCIHMSDAAVQELCDYFTKQYEETGRKVVLALAGDHAPSFVDHVADKTRTEGNDLQILERSTPFFIWANYPLENIDAATSTADSLNRMDMVMLAPTIAQQAGLPLTGYYKYLLAMKQQTPVVTAANDYMKVDGTTGTYGEDESLDAWVKGYLALEYNNIGAHAKRVQSIFGQ